MRLTINLATRRYINQRQLNACLLAAFLILAGLLFLRVRELAVNQAELERVRTLTRTSAVPGRPTVSEAQMKAVSAQIDFANGLIDRKAVGWLTLLDRLEEVVPNGVAITAIEPSQREKILKLSAVALDFDSVRAFLENMERSPYFSEVYLLSQSETKVGQTQKGINFAVTCKAGLR